MTWSDPEAAKSLFETDDVLTEGNISTYLLDNLLASEHPYDYAPADVDVATSTETSIYSKVIAGDDLGTNGALVLDLRGDFLFNNSGADQPTIRVKWGGSTLFTATPDLSSDNSTTNANRKPWSLHVEIANRGATNSQYAYAQVHAVDVRFDTSANGANGTLTGSQTVGRGVNTASVDTTADQTIQVTAQWNTTNANLSWRKRLAVLTLGRN